MAKKYLTCVRYNEAESNKACFKTNTALKKWAKSEGLHFQTWKHNGKKRTSKFVLLENGSDCEDEGFKVDYHVPLLSKKDIK